MQTLTRLESAAHAKRVAHLSEKPAPGSLPGSGSRTERTFEMCTAFDEAVEFAALEGLSIAEAIAAFVEDASPAKCPELADLTACGSVSIDLAKISLPVIPKQLSRLLRISIDDTSPAEIENITAADPVLAGKLLGAANSALFGSRFQIVRLRDAVMRLGIPEARRILLASCFAGLFASKPLHDLWKHSQAVAVAAGDLAELAGLDTEQAYLAGLLHDIGRLIFMKLPARLQTAEREWLAQGFPVNYAETLAYGTDHSAFGAECLATWNLPEGITDAVRLHHRPERACFPLPALLCLAEDLSAEASSSTSEDLWPLMRRTVACLKLGLTHHQLEEFQAGHSTPKRVCA